MDDVDRAVGTVGHETSVTDPGLAAVGLLGLVHPDHLLVADCFLAAMDAAPQLGAIACRILDCAQLVSF